MSDGTHSIKVRMGEIPAHVAMKYLVPVARAMSVVENLRAPRAQARDAALLRHGVRALTIPGEHRIEIYARSDDDAQWQWLVNASLSTSTNTAADTSFHYQRHAN